MTETTIKRAPDSAESSTRLDEGSALAGVGQPGADEDAKKTALRKTTKLMSTRTMAWIDTKIPATSVGQALKDRVTGYTRLEEKGIPAMKMTTRGQMKNRVITVSKDKFAIFCTHSPIRGGKGAFSTSAKKLSFPCFTRKGIRGLRGQKSLRDRYVRYIDVADIDYVQVGVVGTQKLENSRTKNRLKGIDSAVDLKSDQILTIAHHGIETLDLLVPREADRNELAACLKLMVEVYHEAKVNVSRDALLLRYIWYDVDINQDGLIEMDELETILIRLNLYVKNTKQAYQDYVKSHDLDKQDGLTYSQVMTLLQLLKNDKKKSMPNLIWDRIFGEKQDTVDAITFLNKFLYQSQGETTMSLADVHLLFANLNSMEINHRVGEPESFDLANETSRARFEVYLYHEMNDAFDPRALCSKMSSLTKPISRYWINTSHNTYLTGDQIASVSSVASYVKALRRGCKCLELDVWEGDIGLAGEPIPIVYHGHTMTSKILFLDIIRVVKQYMDDNPDSLPVILSLENHCSHRYQSAMANILTTVLGSLLYIPSYNDKTTDLPSPESMRGKVVIKGKRPPDSDDTAEGGEEEDDEDQPKDDPNQYAPDDTNTAVASKEDAKVPEVVKELAALTLLHGTKYKDFAKSIGEPRSHMHSISETKMAKILSKTSSNTPMWRLYNVHHLTRTYPAGSRMDSSNYNPLLAWSMGCQMVALNFQTSDPPLILNDGMFRQNSGCGYLLKPPSVLGKSLVTEDFTQLEETLPSAGGNNRDMLDNIMNSFEDLACGSESSDRLLALHQTERLKVQLEQKEKLLQKRQEVTYLNLQVRVLSGTCLPKPRGEKTGEHIDPYVVVTVHDVSRGKDSKSSYTSTSFTTSTIDDNGFCPVWGDKGQPHEFAVYSPEVAILHFSLREKDVTIDEKVGDAAIPISKLRNGYRSVQLYDYHNTRSGPFDFASLLIEIRASPAQG